MKILLVDDHPPTTRVLARLLKLSGHEVRSANDYAGAIDSARRTRADVLVCDIGLGADGRDGCDLLAEVLAFCPDLKSIALTGFDSPELQERIRRAGFDGSLMKPTTLEALLDAIHSLKADASAPDSVDEAVVGSDRAYGPP
jgi:DNA-binding NarL/FixJ family response regulator